MQPPAMMKLSSQPSPRLRSERIQATGRHVYTHLNYKLGQEVRLVVLAPGETAASLRCEIEHVNLDDDPEYDAVSYTWATEDGSADLSKTIDCIGSGNIPITRNCDAVLRQLRRPETGRKLWVDAICIDQNHVRERNHQVGIMDLIYSKARSVCICIPKPSLSVCVSDYGLLFRWLREELFDADDETKQSLTMDMKQLFARRYFSRVWVIQEVALARAAYLIVNDEELLLTPTVLERLNLLCAKSPYYKLPGVLGRFLVQETRADIVECLYTGWRCQATDRRDCVFAVLSLMPPEARSLIPVDYSMRYDTIQANAVIAIIATRRNLDIISYGKSRILAWWGTRSSLEIDDLRRYLEHTVDSRSRSRFHLKCAFEGQRVGPWHANADVEILPIGKKFKWNLDKHRGKSCIIIRPKEPPVGCLLPRLVVRAHYIDRILIRRLNIHITGAFHYPRRDPLHFWRHEYEPIAQFFRANVAIDDLPIQSGHASYNPSILMKNDKRIVPADLSDFFGIYQDVGEALPLFSSHYSVGFAVHDHGDQDLLAQGDEIFAIDGARVALILRKVETGRYIVISGCYLWAALELDCWNPGSKKGRWGPDVPRPTTKQTRMIEIS